MSSSLFDLQHWAWAQVYMRFQLELPQEELVQSVHIVSIDSWHPNHLVLGRENDGPFFIPGGTREPNEPIDSCAARELREEIGAAIVSPITWIGAHVGRGYKDHPYRPHLPHPRKAWLWGVAEVTCDSLPTNPKDAERVVEVISVDEPLAAELLEPRGSWYAELLSIALSRHNSLRGSDE
ncbi:NUDIX domain-containing protein [Brachybacterium alimentarium]|uniref:NUDIX domain-containing protein n=1 Tax=Brachybacterium alimentarium TaxID=47845 RepID=UPI003FD11E1B